MTYQELHQLREQAMDELREGNYSVDEYRATIISLLGTILNYEREILTTLQELRNFEMS